MIEPHKHCINCGISVPPNENFCSDKCKDEWIKIIKKRKRIILYQSIIISIFIVLIILLRMYV